MTKVSLALFLIRENLTPFERRDQSYDVRSNTEAANCTESEIVQSHHFASRYRERAVSCHYDKPSKVLRSHLREFVPLGR
jgi:hypothetical protein